MRSASVVKSCIKTYVVPSIDTGPSIRFQEAPPSVEKTGTALSQ